MTFNTQNQSILIIGASGRTGNALIEALATHPSHPSIHAFCRDPSKLLGKYLDLCTSVEKGNARKASDVEKALKQTNASWVILSIGDGDSVAKSDIREVSAQATVQILKKSEFQHVRSVVISSSGAGSSEILVGVGLGKLISFHLRHILSDHTQQEAIFRAVASRTTIVRPTSLTDGVATGKLATFGDHEKGPTTKIARADLAAWVVDEVCSGTNISAGRAVNLTSAKQQ